MNDKPVQRRSRQRTEATVAAPRTLRYRHLVNPLLRQPAFSADRVEAIHDAALTVVEELGMKVLDAEARAIYRDGGCEVDEPTQMLRIPRATVAEALGTAPGQFILRGATSERDVVIGGDHAVFVHVGGAPNVNDFDRGRRPATLEDSRNFIRLVQASDVFHVVHPTPEAQDVPVALRHLAVTESLLTLSDKPLYVYARGHGQTRDGFAMVQLAHGLSEAEFMAAPRVYTVINTNSPRQIDVPMARGIVDFARAGQVSVITPFTLAGAMAPVTLTGALTLAHAEALAGVVLAQLARPGAPVIYGSFTSNVDMKTGSPAFGTPEFVKAAFGAGQLARHIGLPWRGSAGTASNTPDQQAVWETLFSLWGSLLGGANMLIHAAGWLEGGLSASYEKFVLDLEMLEIFAEIFEPLPADDDAIALDAIREVAPGGHFFAAAHTMSRYRDAFRASPLAEGRNFGQWQDEGAKTAGERANALWKERLKAFVPPPMDEARREALADFVARRTREGGAPLEE